MAGETLEKLIVGGMLVAMMTFVLMKSLEYLGDWLDGSDDDGEG